jgi:hypothetical protein
MGKQFENFLLGAAGCGRRAGGMACHVRSSIARMKGFAIGAKVLLDRCD